MPSPFHLGNSHQFKQVISKGNGITHLESRSHQSCGQEIFVKSYTATSLWASATQIDSIVLSAEGIRSLLLRDILIKLSCDFQKTLCMHFQTMKKRSWKYKT